MISSDTGNTAWVLVSATLVFFMTPGLALFYGGMSEVKMYLIQLCRAFFNWCDFRGVYAYRIHINFWQRC